MNPRKPSLETQPLDHLREAGARCGIDLAARAVSLFRRDAPGKVATLLNAVEAGDADAVERAAHGLSGSAAQIGARRLAALGRYVETHVGGNTRRLRRLRPLFEAELEDVLVALSSAMRIRELPASRPTRVLVAEDEAHIALFLTHVLAAEGYETRHAATSLDVLDGIRSFRPDVLLLDWFLEDATAAVVLDQMNLVDGPAPAVIVLSSRAQESLRLRDHARYGVAGGLAKPIGPHALLHALKSRGFEANRC